MQAEYYTDRSIAVTGNTKPWKENLKALGGSFNMNLRGRPGWIFPRTQEASVMQFIANANAGMIQPIQPQQQQVATPQMVPMGQIQPAMTPQAALARLTIQPGQPASPGQTMQLGQPIQPPMPTVQIPAQFTRPLEPQPVVVVGTQPMPMRFPNMFVAADGLTYQIVMYTVPLPNRGQRITLDVGEHLLEYVVSAAQKEMGPFDEIFITQVRTADMDPAEQLATSRAVLINGEWKIAGMQEEHTLTFQPMN